MKMFFSPLIPFVNKENYADCMITEYGPYEQRYDIWKYIILGSHYPSLREYDHTIIHEKYIFHHDVTRKIYLSDDIIMIDIIMIGLLDLLIFPLFAKLLFTIVDDTLYKFILKLDDYIESIERWNNLIAAFSFMAIIFLFYLLDYITIACLIVAASSLEMIRYVLGHIIVAIMSLDDGTITYCDLLTLNETERKCSYLDSYSKKREHYTHSGWTLLLSYALKNDIFTLEDLQEAGLIFQDMDDYKNYSSFMLDQYRHALFGINTIPQVFDCDQEHAIGEILIYVDLHDELYNELKNKRLTVFEVNQTLCDLNCEFIYENSLFLSLFIHKNEARTDYLLYIIQNKITVKDFIARLRILMLPEQLYLAKLIAMPEIGLKLFTTIMQFSEEEWYQLFNSIKETYIIEYRDRHRSLDNAKIIIKDSNQCFKTCNNSEMHKFAQYLITTIDKLNPMSNYVYK